MQLLEDSAVREGRRSDSQDNKLTRENKLFPGHLQARAAPERPQSAPSLASLRLSDFQSADLPQREEGEPSSADFGSSERLGSWKEEDVRPNAGVCVGGVRWEGTKRLPAEEREVMPWLGSRANAITATC